MLVLGKVDISIVMGSENGFYGRRKQYHYRFRLDRRLALHRDDIFSGRRGAPAERVSE